MYSNTVRVQLALKRASLRQRHRQNRRIAGLSLLCSVVFGLDMAAIAHLHQASEYHTPDHWMYGATLLPSSTGSYILVAIVAFVVAVAVTILCMKKHEKDKQEEEQT